MAALNFSLHRSTVFCLRCGSEEFISMTSDDFRNCKCPNYMIPDWKITKPGQSIKEAIKEMTNEKSNS